jgi:hypothetical protein
MFSSLKLYEFSNTVLNSPNLSVVHIFSLFHQWMGQHHFLCAVQATVLVSAADMSETGLIGL